MQSYIVTPARGFKGGFVYRICVCVKEVICQIVLCHIKEWLNWSRLSSLTVWTVCGRKSAEPVSRSGDRFLKLPAHWLFRYGSIVESRLTSIRNLRSRVSSPTSVISHYFQWRALPPTGQTWWSYRHEMYISFFRIYLYTSSHRIQLRSITWPRQRKCPFPYLNCVTRVSVLEQMKSAVYLPLPPHPSRVSS